MSCCLRLAACRKSAERVTWRFLRQIFCVSAVCSGCVSTGAFGIESLGVESVSDVVLDTTQQHSASSQRPNIVFILADDLGYTDIAPYGGEVNTPSLSALAEQGVRFTNYHTAVTWSNRSGQPS